MQNPGGEFFGVNYSADSQWITYTKSAKNQMGVVYVHNLNTKQEIAVTENWYDSSSPVFSTDGKYLIFTSARDFNPTYGQLEWNHTYNRMNGIYMAMLAKDTPSPLLPSDGKKDNPKKDEKEELSVKVDADGIFGRIIKLPLPAGMYRNFYSDGKKVYYGSGRDTKAFDLKTQKEETVAEGASFSVTPGSKKAIFSKRGQIFVCDFPTGKANGEAGSDLRRFC